MSEMNPFPTFQQVFQTGMGLGQRPDLGGVDPGAIWNQPFQSPYGQQQGNPQMEMPPDFGGGGGFDPNMGPPPQDQGNDPTPLLGAVANHAQNPSGWAALGNYLSSDSFKDSLMGGIIAGQMAVNPQGALELALRFKQQREDRAFRAQQNQLNRDAQAANIKARAEIEKYNKDLANFRSRTAKAQAQAVSTKFDMNSWIAQHGVPDNPETLALLEGEDRKSVV